MDGTAQHPEPATFMAGSDVVQVFLNGERLPIKSFQEYVGLYIANKEALRVYERISDRWEVCVLASEGQFHQARILIVTIGYAHT